jgi:hypothetical protein
VKSNVPPKSSYYSLAPGTRFREACGCVSVKVDETKMRTEHYCGPASALAGMLSGGLFKHAGPDYQVEVIPADPVAEAPPRPTEPPVESLQATPTPHAPEAAAPPMVYKVVRFSRGFERDEAYFFDFNRARLEVEELKAHHPGSRFSILPCLVQE